MPCMPDENSLFARAGGGVHFNPNAGGVEEPRTPVGSRRGFAELFGPRGQRSTNGFESFGAYLRAFHAADRMHDLRQLAAAGTSVEDVPSAGGFMVPTEDADLILQRAIEQSVVLPRCQQWPMISETKKVLGFPW